jgi:hypothetical protein
MGSTPGSARKNRGGSFRGLSAPWIKWGVVGHFAAIGIRQLSSARKENCEWPKVRKLGEDDHDGDCHRNGDKCADGPPHESQNATDTIPMSGLRLSAFPWIAG